MTPEVLDEALSSTPGAVGATAVSPTYFGAVADVRGLAEVAHSHGVPLVVDEAWGAHLAFSDELPEHALACGADLVVSSIAQDRGQPHPVGDRPPRPRRADRRARGGPLRDAGRVDEPELAARRVARRRPPAGGGERPRAARPDARGPARSCAPRFARSTASTCSTSGWWARRECTPTTRCGWRSTCAARARPATSWPPCCGSATT